MVMNSGGEKREVEQRGRSARGARARRHAPLVTYVLSITLVLLRALRAQLIVSIYYLRIREIAITSIDTHHLFRLSLLRDIFLVCVIIKERFFLTTLICKKNLNL